MDKIDSLIESATVQAQLAVGISPKLVAVRSSFGSRGVAVFAAGKSEISEKSKSPKWSETEDRLLCSCLGMLAEEDIADILGRSPNAVHLRWSRDLRLPAPSKNPDYMTGNQIANGIGKDIHGVMRLIDRGILQGYILPSVRRIRLVHRMTLLCFLVNPKNWCYFDPDRIGLMSHTRRFGKNHNTEFWTYARRLVKKRKSLWDDEWWSIGKVARHRKIHHAVVNNAIRKGLLPATDWGNWWVLKSHATDMSIQLQAFKGSGGKGYDRLNITAKAKAFLILADAIGIMYSEIAALMNFKEKRVSYLLQVMRRRGQIQQTIKENCLKVHYNRKTGETFASWKIYRDRFPRLARLMESFGDRVLNKIESRYINRVNKKAEMWKQKCRQK